MNGGNYPETIALVLWGTDNIKTYGESLAQVSKGREWHTRVQEQQAACMFTRLWLTALGKP
jgi:cobalamin biosynthesis Mg chelatase CobN